MGTVGFELEPLADYALTRIHQSEPVFADELTLRKTGAVMQGQADLVYGDRPFGKS